MNKVSLKRGSAHIRSFICKLYMGISYRLVVLDSLEFGSSDPHKAKRVLPSMNEDMEDIHLLTFLFQIYEIEDVFYFASYSKYEK